MNKFCAAAIIVVTIGMSSCSFNKVFFQPTVIPAAAKGQTMVNTETHDTSKVYFCGTNHQPVFTKNRDTVDLGYSIESVVFKSTDGNMLNGWLLKPRGSAATITVVYLHGNGCNLYCQYPLIDGLVKRGMQVFMFDYSGYGFSEGRATKETSLQDALTAIDYVKGRADTKGTKLVVYGQSLGGHLSATAAERRQEVVDALVIEGAFSSRKDIAAHNGRNMFIPGFIGRALVNQTYSAKSSIKKFHKPVLVVHSTEDETIPFRMGKKIFENANEPKWFYEIKGPHVRGVQLYADSIAAKMNRMVYSSGSRQGQ